MQVLLDGRPLYEPFFGGVNLNRHPIFLENIERIEVIRGSAGVTWGVNCLNGVINFISKKPKDTQGRLGYGAFGNREFQEGFIRYGGSNNKMSYRGTVGAHHDDGFGADHGEDVKDWMNYFQTSGMADVKLSDGLSLVISGGHKNLSSKDRPDSMQYMNLLLKRDFNDGSSMELRWSESFYKQWQSWYELYAFTREDMVEFTHNFQRGNHSIVWGADYIRDSIKHRREGNPVTGNTSPDHFANDQASIFIEDEITLGKNLWFTIGYRGHYNEFTHFDWAGKTALVWEVFPKHFLRGSISRSFRRPVFYEEILRRYVKRSLGWVKPKVAASGNDSLRNERLVSYEVGYKGQLTDNLVVNVEAFYNKHKDLIGENYGKWGERYATGWMREYDYRKFFNLYDVVTYGFETSFEYRPFKWWLMRGYHVYTHQTDEKDINRTGAYTGNLKVYSVPKHKMGMTNRVYIDDKTTLNTHIFWTSNYFNRYDADVDSYMRVDFRIARQFWKDTAEIAFGITNLTDTFHHEGDSSDQTNQVPRQVYFQFFYSF